MLEFEYSIEPMYAMYIHTRFFSYSHSDTFNQIKTYTLGSNMATVTMSNNGNIFWFAFLFDDFVPYVIKMFFRRSTSLKNVKKKEILKNIEEYWCKCKHTHSQQCFANQEHLTYFNSTSILFICMLIWVENQNTIS